MARAAAYNSCMKIASIQPPNPFFLAPMAGYTCSSMRRVCIELGAGMVTTEMVVAMHLVRAPEETVPLLHYEESERPIIAQLAAWEAPSAAEAARMLYELGFDGVDLNLGCSVRRIVSAGMGSALAADAPRLREVLTAMVKAAKLPVTAKMRSGPDAKTETAVEVARRCEDCGAAAVAVHGRHAAQAYRGAADWGVIRRAKENVGIPVIGNGGIRTPQDAVNMLKETGCDAVMIARGAVGNPWIFDRSRRLLEGGDAGAPPTPEETRRVMLRHYALLVEEKGQHTANLLFRKQTSYYARFAPHPKQLRHAVHNAGTDDDLSVVIREHVR